MYKSTSIDPLNDVNLRSEHYEDGSLIIRNHQGQIVRTVDAIGIRRDFGREALTHRLMVRKHGVWTKLDGAGLDESGTLFYRRGEVEIQERLSAVHIHTNKRTGVMIQTDHVNHCEIMKQSNGEVWKREVEESRELFEMWMQGKLSFRTLTYFEPCRCEVMTPSGTQPLVYVSRLEQSWSNGVIARERYTFRNPLNQEKDVTLTVPVNGKLITLRHVCAVITLFENGQAKETTYELTEGTPVRVELGGSRRDLNDIQRVRQFANSGEPMLGFATASGAEAVFSTWQ